MAQHAAPGQPGSPVSVQGRYGNYIGGEFVPPVKGQYFENPSPVTGQPFTEIARSTAEDVELALDAAHGAKRAWGRTSATERANILNKIGDRIEANLESLAVAETWDNGKPVRETLAADLPLVVDHFRYYAGAIRAQEGSLSEIDGDTIAYHFHEPLGVVGQIIPWNFPLLMATWKLAPALAAGNCVVLKPAEQTPWSILKLLELVGEADVLLGELPVPGLDRPVPFWMSVSQYEYWKHTHLTVDVVPGRGGGFSVEAPEGVRFLIRSRLLTEEEMTHFRLAT